MPVDPSPSPAPHRPSDAARTPAKPLVLVVDDDAPMRAMARHFLEESGYEVTEAESGRNALARLRGGPLPDYLVTDLKMADGSGGWLVSQVGYELPALLARTVVITGAATSASAAHVSARWRCPVVPKPFTGAELVGALRRVGGGEDRAGG
ncbi:MAG TPA: response regulator [Gemmatimonadaceae bacterium]|nr:response regulator [Gemmatimonadaceae bacterium]